MSEVKKTEEKVEAPVEDETQSEVRAEECVAEGTSVDASKGKEKKPRKKRSKGRIGATIGVVAVVIVAAGAGFMVWHDQPSFCNAICHVPMDGYLTTYEATPGEPATDKWGNEVADASGMLASVHAQEGITCVECHVPQLGEQISEGMSWVTGSYNVVQTVDERFVPEEKDLSQLSEARGIASEEFCLNSGCHVNDDGSNMTRDDLIEKTSYMTRNPHVEEHNEVACSECHKAHRASTVYCSKCHSDATIPEGWVSYSESEALEPVSVSQ